MGGGTSMYSSLDGGATVCVVNASIPVSMF